MDRKNPEIHRILEAAADIVRRCKEATGNIEPTESYKRRQIEELIDYADSHSLWIDIKKINTIYLDKGGENEVFFDGASTVYKLNNFEYAGEDLTNFFIRLKAHNLFFGNVPYNMKGFSYNNNQEFCAVITQPYIKAIREARPKEISCYMTALGFTQDYNDEYHNDEYEIFDVVPNNVLYGIDNHLYFIDTQIKLRG